MIGRRGHWEIDLRVDLPDSSNIYLGIDGMPRSGLNGRSHALIVWVRCPSAPELGRSTDPTNLAGLVLRLGDVI